MAAIYGGFAVLKLLFHTTAQQIQIDDRIARCNLASMRRSMLLIRRRRRRVGAIFTRACMVEKQKGVHEDM